jgi:hypothetical protein
VNSNRPRQHQRRASPALRLLFLALSLCTGTVAHAQDEYAHGAAEVSAPPAKLSDGQIQAIGCFDLHGKIEHKNCTLSTSFDLTNIYHTSAKWQFAIVDDQSVEKLLNTAAAVSPTQNICFIEDGKPSCGYDVMDNHTVYDPAGHHAGPEDGYSTPTVSLVYPTPGSKFPILILRTSCAVARCGVATMIWAYHSQSRKFEQIWFDYGCGCHLDGSYLFSSGPLAGYLTNVIAGPTNHWPWPYGIEVYHLTASQYFHKRLYFIGKASQAGDGPIGDGPGGPVITTDMPELLRRLHLPQQ